MCDAAFATSTSTINTLHIHSIKLYYVLGSVHFLISHDRRPRAYLCMSLLWLHHLLCIFSTILQIKNATGSFLSESANWLSVATMYVLFRVL